jgi:hypothetical protein
MTTTTNPRGDRAGWFTLTLMAMMLSVHPIAG